MSAHPKRRQGRLPPLPELIDRVEAVKVHRADA
ncbi:MAG: hypothetical protein QOF84_3845 [Streptomyces sp.]|nr:hypothetical protein [Streptomyces sp.]